MSFETEDFFKTGGPPPVLSTESKNRFKSPVKNHFVFQMFAALDSIFTL